MFVFQSEISIYSLNQIFAIACLGKKLGFRTEYCDYFEYLILNNFENRSFLLGHRVVQIEPNLVWSIPRVGRLWDKNNFWYSLPWKKVSFPYGNLRFPWLANFKSRSFLLDQGVVQSEPNWYPRLAVLFSLECKKNGPPNFPRKKVRISIGNIDLFAWSNFCYSLSRRKVRFSYGILRLFWIFDFK